MKSLDKKIDSAMGALVGAAVGDALGAPLEFLTPRPKDEWVTEMEGGGVLKWQPGDITDDTIMSIAVCEMYIDKGGYDQRTLVEKWLKWKSTGPKDIGNWTSHALSRWNSYLKNHDATSKDPVDVVDGKHPAVKLWFDGGQHDAGNGGVMRCMPTALWEPLLNDRVVQTTRICMDTHPDPKCIESCIITVETLHEMIETEMTKDGVMQCIDQIVKNFVRNEEIKKSLSNIKDLGWKDTDNGGYTVDTMQAAISGFYLSENFEDGLVAVVNKGNDADTVGAVAGALMGAFYGYKSIPARWLEKLSNTNQMLDFAQKLYTRKTTTWKKLLAEEKAIDIKNEQG